MTKKKTPAKRDRITLKAIYDLLAAHHWVQESHPTVEALVKDLAALKEQLANQPQLLEAEEIADPDNAPLAVWMRDINQMVDVLLAHCSNHDKALGSIEHCVRHLMDDANAMLVRVNKQDLQIDRLIKINWLMMRELQRFCKENLEPATVASIRRDLKTPDLTEPAFHNRGAGIAP